MSSDDLNKRARQKQRREQKLAEQRAADARARRTRLIGLGVIGVVLIAVVGVVVQRQLEARQLEEDTIAEANERLGALGCTEIVATPNLGGGHLQTDPTSLVAASPETLYADRPTTSGQHLPSVALTGVYDEQIDERLLLHNLEHGYVNVWYGPDSPPEMVEALKADAQARIDADNPKMIVAAYGEPLPEAANFAFVSWGERQLCRDFDAGVLTAYLAQEYGIDGDAPEKLIEAHTVAGNGAFDPNAEEGPLLFPPLGEDAAPSEQPAGSSENPESEAPEGSEVPTGAVTPAETAPEDAIPPTDAAPSESVEPSAAPPS